MRDLPRYRIKDDDNVWIIKTVQLFNFPGRKKAQDDSETDEKEEQKQGNPNLSDDQDDNILANTT